MSTVKSKKLQVGTDATATNNFTIYQPATPDGTLRIGVGNADSPTEVGRFNSNGYVATNAPAFRATLSGTQNISDSTETKVQFDTKTFDTASCYDNTTNYRFTPNVAGYYQVNLTLDFRGTSKTSILGYIYKNGTEDSRIFTTRAATSAYEILSGSVLIYMNGTTDYIEAYGQIIASANNNFNINSQFSAFLVRGT